MSLESQHKLPLWFWISAWFAVAWNVFGVVQFVHSVTATQESFVAMGMSEAQAQTMLSYPLWMTVGFAVGTFGGLLGSVLLLLRKKIATPVFAASLAGYVVLYIGDITEGVFEAIGASQVAILTSVVLIAAALLWLSRHLERRRQLV